MASHSPHPDSHTHGLADDCERCEQLAGRPWELDDENLSHAWARMLAVEFAHPERESYRSRNEAALGKRLYEMALLLERLGVNPRNLIVPVP